MIVTLVTDVTPDTLVADVTDVTPVTAVLKK
jgi:hypothetical protein